MYGREALNLRQSGKLKTDTDCSYGSRFTFAHYLRICQPLSLSFPARRRPLPPSPAPRRRPLSHSLLSVSPPPPLPFSLRRPSRPPLLLLAGAARSRGILLLGGRGGGGGTVASPSLSCSPLPPSPSLLSASLASPPLPFSLSVCLRHAEGAGGGQDSAACTEAACGVGGRGLEVASQLTRRLLGATTRVEAGGRWPSGGGGAHEGGLQRVEAGGKRPARKVGDEGGAGDGQRGRLGIGGGRYGPEEGVRGPAWTHGGLSLSLLLPAAALSLSLSLSALYLSTAASPSPSPSPPASVALSACLSRPLRRRRSWSLLPLGVQRAPNVLVLQNQPAVLFRADSVPPTKPSPSHEEQNTCSKDVTTAATGSGRLNAGGKNGSEVLYGCLMLRLGMGRTTSDGPMALDERANKRKLIERNRR